MKVLEPVYGKSSIITLYPVYSDQPEIFPVRSESITVHSVDI